MSYRKGQQEPVWVEQLLLRAEYDIHRESRFRSKGLGFRQVTPRTLWPLLLPEQRIRRQWILVDIRWAVQERMKEAQVLR